MNKYLVGICAYNEGEKIKRVLRKFSDHSLYDVMLVDDASHDGSLDDFSSNDHLRIVSNSSTRGAGYGVRLILEYARQNGYEAVFFVSGNDKDRPQDITGLREAIEAGYDFVQGSRYLAGGNFGRMPVYRMFATRIMHPLVFWLFAGRRFTDTTNGFRAVRIAMLADSKIDLQQEWLDQYELEPYLFFKAVRLGYKVTEVPVVKVYPPREQGYTKMRPFSGWWSILRPLIYLGLGIKK